MAEIALVKLHKRFGSVQALQGVDLTIPDHVYLCLLGPSGCGKTTLLRIIAGLEDAEEGRILIGERRVDALEPFARNVGMAFQNYALYPHLDVRGNLAFPLNAPRRRGQYPGDAVERRVREIAALLRIDALLDRPVVTLSGGQKQRVALGRALICDPAVLLLDEPVTHLDARLRHEMRVELKLLQRRLGTTTIHVTHDQLEALAVADLVVVMRDGRIEQIGSPDDIVGRPATPFVAGFVGDPPMSLLRGPVRADGDDRLLLQLGAAALALPATARLALAGLARSAIELAVPASDIRIAAHGEAGAVTAIVQAHEWIGRELQLVVALDGASLRFRTLEPLAARIGERLPVAVDLARAHLFNPTTGRRIEVAA